MPERVERAGDDAHSAAVSPSLPGSADVPGQHTPVAPVHYYSMQRRLLAVTLSILALVWVSVVVGTYWHTRHEVSELLDAHLMQTAQLLAAQPVDEIGDNEREQERHEHGGMPPPGGHRYRLPVIFQVWKHGELLTSSAHAPYEPLRGSGPDMRGFSVVQIGHGRWRAYTTAGREPGVEIIVAEDIHARKGIVRASVSSMLYSLLLAFPLLALAIWWSLRQGMQPLLGIGEHIRQRSPQSHAPLQISPLPSEIRPMTDALNQLFVRMGDMLHNERRFTADAAHELRTPIAAIRMMAQVAQGAQHSQEREQALLGVVQGCDRATRLVEQLLQLARVEGDQTLEQASSPGGSMRDILPALGQVVADLQKTQAMPRKQQIDWQAPARLMSGLSPALAGVLLRNLLDNALRYSPEGATIRVELVQTGATGMRWMVEDSGPGMPPDAISKLGQRFYRVLGTGQTGSGLGWSIVRRIAALGRLDVQVERSESLGGLKVVLFSQTEARTGRL